MPELKPGARVENSDSKRRAFVLFRSNTSDDVVVRFDDFAYNSLVPARCLTVLPDEPFRTSAEPVRPCWIYDRKV